MPSNLELGSIFQSQYLLLQLIEQKDFEYTYLVENQRQSNERLLLKKIIPKDKNTTEKLENSYRRELNSLLGLNHPQIQQYKDIFWDNGQLFVVQSFLNGQTYEELMGSRSRRLTEPEAVEFLKRILPVLEQIHSKNVTHQNISPKSIVLRVDDGLPVLTNFGAVQEVKQQLSISTAETQILDNLAGFPGDFPDGVNQDLYNLAVTVLILLTGQKAQYLFNEVSRSWHWEQVLLSDQLEQVLNRMLHGALGNECLSASHILGMLNNSLPTSAPQYTDAPQYAELTKVDPTILQQTKTVSPITASSSLNNWQVALISGGLVGILGLAGLLFMSYIQRPEAQKAISEKLEEEQTAQIQQELEKERPLELSKEKLPGLGREKQLELATEQPLELERQRKLEAGIPLQQELQDQLELERQRRLEAERRLEEQRRREEQRPPQQEPPRQLRQGTNTNATVAGIPGIKNIRSGPGTTYSVVGSINTGIRVEIVSQSQDQGGYLWYKISHPSSGTQGWIAAQLISLD